MYQYSYLPEGVESEDFKNLSSIMLSEIAFALRKYVEEHPEDAEAMDLYIEFITPSVDARESATITALRFLTATIYQPYSFTITTPSGKIIDLNKNIQPFSVIVQVFGRDAVEEIVKKYCEENDIDYDNICYNGHTKKEINKSLANDKTL